MHFLRNPLLKFKTAMYMTAIAAMCITAMKMYTIYKTAVSLAIGYSAVKVSVV